MAKICLNRFYADDFCKITMQKLSVFFTSKDRGGILCLPACFEIIAVVLVAPKVLGITILEAAIMGSVIAAVSPAVIVPRMIKLIKE